ncbi:MAG: nuclear transport factor 2 family protein [Acidobacteriia bacterium]|nr:nuclear transport factor 2 family protein [Terriglobia bacterium]
MSVKTKEALKPKEIVQALLNGVHNPETVQDLCAKDVTYVSLNYSNPDLHKIMPWCGTGHGVDAISKTFHDVSEYWKIDSFVPEAIFGEDENVAVFGRFTYTSTKLGKTVTSPFAIFCKVSDGKVTYMQFMEDTFATGASFRSGGSWTFQSDPRGGEVEI